MGDNETGAGSQELDAGLVADLDAAAGEECHAAAQVGAFGALGKVERRTRWAGAGRRNDESTCSSACRRSSSAGSTVSRKSAFAFDVALLEVFGRKNIRRGEDGLLAELPDASGGKERLSLATLAALLFRWVAFTNCRRWKRSGL